MTTTRADARTPVAPPREGPQWRAVTRLLAGEAMTNLVWATGVMLALIGAGWLVAQLLGWELVADDAPGFIGVQVTADQSGVVSIVSSLFLFVIVIAVGVTALVNQIMFACRTRVLVASGATRRSVAVALLLTAVAMVLYFMVVLTVVVLVVGGGPNGAVSLLDVDNAGELAIGGVRVAGLMTLVTVAGTAIVAMFLRWPWWVGTIALTLFLTVLPWLLGIVIGERTRISEMVSWWGFDMIAAVLVAAAYWLIARRVPVR